MRVLALAVLLSVAIHASLATRGVDLSQAASQSTFTCLKNGGYSFAIVRGYCSFGGIDSSAKASIQAAANAGLYHDAYHFPCMGKVSPQTQVDQIVNYLGNLPGEYWIDVEHNPSAGCGWQGAAANCNFLEQLVNAFKGKGKTPGIYASKSQWTTIMGSAGACAKFAGLPLWYPHYDNVQNFNDFSSFGGWSKPTIKQYVGDTTACGLGVDLDWYP